jgi:SAM-dependent methyltransferase
MDDNYVAGCWDNNAPTWANDVRRGYDTYRDLFNNPEFFRFCGNIAGLDVLDLGCGEGYNTRLFAKQGARMTGVDISPEMIRHAREAEKECPLAVRYEVATASDLSPFPSEHFDAVVATMAMMDVADYGGTVAEVARVLRNGGSFVFSTSHPCLGYGRVAFEPIPEDIASPDADSGPRAVFTGNYFSHEPSLQVWRFRRTPADEPGEPFSVPRFPRTLSTYLNALPQHGMQIVRIEEPRPSDEACREDPRLRKCQSVPAFLYVKAVKPH